MEANSLSLLNGHFATCPGPYHVAPGSTESPFPSCLTLQDAPCLMSCEGSKSSLYLLLLFYFFVLEDRVSLCDLGSSAICYVVQTGL